MKIKKNLLNGLVVLLPMAVSILIVWIVGEEIYNSFVWLIDWIGATFGWPKDEVLGNILAVLVVASACAVILVAVYVVGVVVPTAIGAVVHGWVESLLSRLPHYEPIRDALKLIVQSFTSSGGLLSKPVRFNFGGVEVYGLLVGDCDDVLRHGEAGVDKVTVYASISPIPSGGVLLAVPVEDVSVILGKDGNPITIADFVTKYNVQLGTGLNELHYQNAMEYYRTEAGQKR